MKRSIGFAWALSVFYCIPTLAFNLDCEGKKFSGLTSDKDEVRGGGFYSLDIGWGPERLVILEKDMSSYVATMWSIDRKDLSLRKRVSWLMEDREDEETTGQCKTYESDNAI